MGILISFLDDGKLIPFVDLGMILSSKGGRQRRTSTESYRLHRRVNEDVPHLPLVFKTFSLNPPTQ